MRKAGRRREGVPANRRLVSAGQIEGGQQAIAHELEDLAVVGLDRGRHRLEIDVERLDENVGRLAIGQLGEAAQIGEPDDGADCLGRAALDRARQHPMAGVPAEIGLEHRARDVVGQARLHGESQVRKGLNDLLELPVIEAFGSVGGAGEEDAIEALGRPGRAAGSCRALGNDVRQRGIVGHDVRRIIDKALLTQLPEQHKLVRALRVKPPAQRQEAFAAHEVNRAFQVDVSGLYSALARRVDDTLGARLPNKGVRPIPGVQRVHAHLGPLHRKTAIVNSLAEAGDLLAQRQTQHAPLHQPEGKAVEIERREGRGV